MNVAYFLLTEYASKDQRAEIDRMLAGPKAQSSRRERVDVARAVGGAVRAAAPATTKA